MTVVRHTCGERWSIEEGVRWSASRHLVLLVESVNLFPVSEHFFLLFGEAGAIINYRYTIVSIGIK